jgi:quercetin dioxygenase-like cupin family protein
MSETKVLEGNGVEFIDECDGIYIRAYKIANVGDSLHQHKHAVNHATIIASGAARLILNGENAGDFEAFHVVRVVAGDVHSFVALKPDTRILCVFNASDPALVDVKEL